MKILITGGAGYLGSVLIEQLYAHKNDLNFSQIVVYDNMMYNQTSLIHYAHKKDFKFVFGDVRNHQLLLKYINEADVIIPLAAIVGFPACDADPVLAQAVNVEQIRFITQHTNDKIIVFPNTNSGYGIGEEGLHCTEKSPLNPLSLYGKTKVEAEKLILDYGGISLRLATVFGSSPRMRMDLLVNEFVYKALTDKYITLFEHTFVRNYIHIRDVARAFIFMIRYHGTYSGQAFNVGLSDANLTKKELVEKIQQFIPQFAVTYSDYYEDPDKRNYIVSNDKIESTGWEPSYSLEDGIEELIKSYDILLQDLNSKYRNGFPLGYANKT